jgi:hypothetical protein
MLLLFRCVVSLVLTIYLLLLLSSPALRGRVRSQLVMSVTIVNLVKVLCLWPLSVALIVGGGRVKVSCWVEIVDLLISSFLHPVVNLWGVTLLLLHYVTCVCALKLPKVGEWVNSRGGQGQWGEGVGGRGGYFFLNSFQ